MTLDERLEALTQSVELLASMHTDNEGKLAALDKKFTEAVADIKDLLNRMGRILEHHDLSIDDHEERIDRLERPDQ